MPQIPGIDEIRNPLLTNFAQGNVTPGYVNRAVCPPVPVTKNHGSYRVNQNGSFVVNDARARNTEAKSIEFGYGYEKFNIYEKALSCLIDKEDIKDAKDIDDVIELKIDGVRAVDTVLETNREKRVADIIMGAAYYDAGLQIDLTEGDNVPWTDQTDSDPLLDVSTAREAVRVYTGMLPNSLVLGHRAYSALRNNAVLKAMLSITDNRGLLTVDQLKFLFEVDNIIVGNSVYNTADLGEAPVFADFWGEHCSVINIPTAEQIKMGLPVLASVFENNSRSAVYEVDKGEVIRVILKRFYDVIHISKYNGYLIKNVVGA